jgi:hypothetical protein
MRKREVLIILLAVIITGIAFWNCSENPTNPSSQCGSSLRPNINIKVGAVYRYTNDSLSASDSNRTRIITTNSALSKGTFYGQNNAVQVYSVSRDTVNNQPVYQDTIYVKYDSSGGIFYQYGLVRMLDTTQAATWDKVADFCVPMGTQYQIASFDTYFGTLLHVDLKGKVAAETSIQTTGSPPQSILCYRIEMTAVVTASGLPVTTIYVYYYLGYSPASSPGNPSGMVKLRMEPFSVYGNPRSGFDQILQRFAIP